MENLITALGTALLHSLWQGALVALAALSALQFARAARTRHALACGALLLCLLLPAATFARTWAPRTASATAPVARVALEPAPAPPSLPGLRPYPVDRIQAFLPHLRTWALPRLVLLWACGAGLMMVHLGSGWALSLRWRRLSVPAPGPWQARLDALGRRMGLRRVVRLRLWERGTGPLTYGAWRPVVLLPAACLTHLDPDHLEALLAHELAHVRRLDYLLNLLQSVALCLLFYHPAVWWLAARIRAERELAADGLAAQALGDPRRLALALNALDDLSETSRAPLPALGARGGSLLERIRHLLQSEVRPAAVPWLAPAMLTVAMLSPLGLQALVRRPSVQPPETTPSMPAPRPAPVPPAPHPAKAMDARRSGAAEDPSFTPPIRVTEDPFTVTGQLWPHGDGLMAAWSLTVPHGPEGLEVEILSEADGKSLGRVSSGVGNPEGIGMQPLVVSHPRISTYLPTFPSAVIVQVRDWGRRIQGQTRLAGPYVASRPEAVPAAGFSLKLDQPLGDPAAPSSRRTPEPPAVLEGVLFMRGSQPWMLVSASPIQETFLLTVYGDDPGKPLASGSWNPTRSAFAFSVDVAPRVLRLRLVDATGRVRSSLIPLTLEPGFVGSRQSTRQDFKLRLD